MNPSPGPLAREKPSTFKARVFFKNKENEVSFTFGKTHFYLFVEQLQGTMPVLPMYLPPETSSKDI